MNKNIDKQNKNSSLGTKWVYEILQCLVDSSNSKIYWINHDGLKTLIESWGLQYIQASKYQNIKHVLASSTLKDAIQYAKTMRELCIDFLTLYPGFEDNLTIKTDRLQKILERLETKIIPAQDFTSNEKASAALAETYFDELNEKVLEKINECKMVIWISMYTFTKTELLDALVRKAQEGVTIEIILSDNEHNTKANIKHYWEKMTNVYWYPEGGKEDWYSKNHQKFALIDGKVVCHGSNNFTHSADRQANHMTIDENEKVIDQFIEEWKRIRTKLMNETKSSTGNTTQPPKIKMIGNKGYVIRD